MIAYFVLLYFFFSDSHSNLIIRLFPWHKLIRGGFNATNASTFNMSIGTQLGAEIVDCYSDQQSFKPAEF